MNKAAEFFSPTDKELIQQAVRLAELDTSGEIRVHIEVNCPGDVMDRAADLFRLLKMHKTRDRNGVLIYLSVGNRKFAILGDAGINTVVPENFWDDIKFNMLNHFREERFTQGLCEAISAAGEQLRTHFPYLKGDINELNDDISFGSN